MAQAASDLRQIKGIGDALVRRLQDAGLDSFAGIAGAGEEELKQIKGLNPRNIASIREQAQKLAESREADGLAAIEALQSHIAGVRQQIQTLAQSARDRFQDQIDGKFGKKLSIEMVRIEDCLSGLKLEGKKGVKRASKALDKVDKRLGGLSEDASVKKVRKTFKRARKAIGKAAR